MCRLTMRLSEYVRNRSEALHNAIIGDDRAINDFVRQELGRKTEDDAPALRQLLYAGRVGVAMSGDTPKS
jgi:hypothetical protein